MASAIDSIVSSEKSFSVAHFISPASKDTSSFQPGSFFRIEIHVDGLRGVGGYSSLLLSPLI